MTYDTPDDLSFGQVPHPSSEMYIHFSRWGWKSWALQINVAGSRHTMHKILILKHLPLYSNITSATSFARSGIFSSTIKEGCTAHG
jgi:hypothetical protein